MEQDIRLPMAEGEPFIEIDDKNPLYAIAQQIHKKPENWVDRDLVLIPKRDFSGKTRYLVMKLDSEKNAKILLDKAEISLNHNTLYSPTKQKFYEYNDENLEMIKKDIHDFYVEKVVKNKRWRIKYVDDLQKAGIKYKDIQLKKISRWLKKSETDEQIEDDNNIFKVSTLYPEFQLNEPYINPKKSNMDYLKKVLDKVVREKADNKYFTVRINGVYYTLNRKTI